MNLDLNEYRRCLLLCRAAYDLSLIPNGDGWSKPALILAKYLPLRFAAHNPTFGYVIANGDRLYVVFRGTESPEEWILDFDCAPDGNGVHGGIDGIYACLQSGMVDAISSFGEQPGRTVRFLGHSLGGGLAAIAAESTPGASSFTFGAPRVFTRSRAATLQSQGIRIINEHDIVPEQPGRRGIWDFAHKSETFRFAGNSLLWKDAHSLEVSYGPAADANNFAYLQDLE